MTDRERLMIQEYLPNPPDPTLGVGEYYYLQSTRKGEQVIKVTIVHIFPGRSHEPTEYGIYQVCANGLKWVDVGYGDHFRGCTMRELYDNKEDCKNQAHMFCYEWEELRELQQKEASA